MTAIIRQLLDFARASTPQGARRFAGGEYGHGPACREISIFYHYRADECIWLDLRINGATNANPYLYVCRDQLPTVTSPRQRQFLLLVLINHLAER